MNVRHLNTDEFSGEVARILEDAGYREFKSYKDTARMFQKTIREPLTDPEMPVPVEGCDDNNGKFFFTVEVHEWAYGYADHEQSKSISVEVRGSKRGVHWKLEAWLHTVDDLRSRLGDLEYRLAAAWQTVTVP